MENTIQELIEIEKIAVESISSVNFDKERLDERIKKSQNKIKSDIEDRTKAEIEEIQEKYNDMCEEKIMEITNESKAKYDSLEKEFKVIKQEWIEKIFAEIIE